MSCLCQLIAAKLMNTLSPNVPECMEHSVFECSLEAVSKLVTTELGNDILFTGSRLNFAADIFALQRPLWTSFSLRTMF